MSQSTVAMAALIVLAGCLPGYAKLDGDLRPSDTQADSVVDEGGELRLYLLLRSSSAPDLLQHLGAGMGTWLRLAGRFCWRWAPIRL